MNRILVSLAGFISVLVGVASPSAVFEVDLLRYEALPNKCCDGYRNVHFGPLKCNECDPYFNICLRPLPSGSSHCVKTSRENNVHTTDLSHGNIQPNHLSTTLTNWQGSLLVDVDINDYDSVGKDDDIDHLYYTYRGSPDPTSQTVAINGTKVRLTIAIRIYCSPNYFGADCSKLCTNGSNSYCDTNGTIRCNPGYSGAPNCIPVSSLKTTSPVPSISTSSNAPSTTDPATKTPKTNAPTTNSPTTKSTATIMSVTNVSNSPEILSSTIRHMNNVTSSSRTFKSQTTTTSTQSGTEQQEHMTSDMVSTKQHHTTVSRNEGSSPVSTTGQMDLPTSPMASGDGHTSSADGVTTAGIKGGDTTTEESDGAESTTAVPSTTGSIEVPEPLELYFCNLLVQGHRAGVHTQVVTVLYSALAAHPHFVPNNLLGVKAIASTFEVTDNGLAVTDVSYVVHYNGHVLRSETVLQTLTLPPSSTVLQDRLAASNITRYTPQPQAVTDTSTTAKFWVSSHLPFVITTSCLLAILLLIATVLIIDKRRGRKCIVRSRPLRHEKDTEGDMGYDSAFSMENPLYDYSNDLQPYKHSVA